MGRDKDKEITNQLASLAKWAQLRKTNGIYCQLKRSWAVRNKETKTPSPLHLFPSQLSYLLPQRHTEVSVHHSSSSLSAFLLTLLLSSRPFLQPLHKGSAIAPVPGRLCRGTGWNRLCPAPAAPTSPHGGPADASPQQPVQ